MVKSIQRLSLAIIVVCIGIITTNQGKEMVTEAKLNKKREQLETVRSESHDDFIKDIKKENPDVKGWIQVTGTNINEPFVQGNDNDYYLTHDYDGTSNSSGALFLDYMSSTGFSDTVTYIYGHNSITQKKFYELEKFDNLTKSNELVKIFTSEGSYTYEIFASLMVTPQSSLYPENKYTPETFHKLQEELVKNGVDIELVKNFTSEDKFLLLVTCKKYNDSSARRVVLTRLIEKELYSVD